MNTNEQYNRLSRRVEKLEQRLDNSISNMSSNINALNKEVIEIKIVNQSVNKQQQESLDELKSMIKDLDCDLSTMREKPGARWDLVITAILTASGSMLGTGIVRALMENLN